MVTTDGRLVKLFKQGALLHAVFIAGLLLMTSIIALLGPANNQVWPKSLVTFLLLAACIYTGRWLTQQFLVKNKWAYLVSIFCISTIAFSLAGIFSMAYLMGIKDGSDLSALVVPIPLLSILFIFVGGFIAITRIVIRQQIKEISILQYQSKTELNLLTSKLSPHFLFNTLHNLYGLSRNDHTKVPDLLLKLSDLLSYALHSSNKPLVNLREEVEYIQNFIELEKIRIGNRLELQLHITRFEHSIYIAPMLLIVFVENAFKHAKNMRSKKIQISIKMEATDHFIHFEIKNSKGAQSKPSTETKTGLGIITTIQRLNLIYGDSYLLKCDEKEKTYLVTLKIPYNAAY